MCRACVPPALTDARLCVPRHSPAEIYRIMSQKQIPDHGDDAPRPSSAGPITIEPTDDSGASRKQCC